MPLGNVFELASLGRGMIFVRVAAVHSSRAQVGPYIPSPRCLRGPFGSAGEAYQRSLDLVYDVGRAEGGESRPI